jgi:protein-arginine kinase
MSLPFETKKVPDWLEGDGPDKDVVLSSRVRLARNLSGHPFPDQASEETDADDPNRPRARQVEEACDHVRGDPTSRKMKRAKRTKASLKIFSTTKTEQDKWILKI